MREEFSKTLRSIRKEKGFTQEYLADQVGVSFQSVSKWENGLSMPDLEIIYRLADILDTDVNTLSGYNKELKNTYDKEYRKEKYYWGIKPSSMCYKVMEFLPPLQPYSVLDIGCGEGKDAVFFARNGYKVSGFDVLQSGIEKSQRLAQKCNVDVHFFQADFKQFRLRTNHDIIFSSGAFYLMPKNVRVKLINEYKNHTNIGGIHAINTFVSKPFIEDCFEKGKCYYWKSGELLTYYTDWEILFFEEKIFDCNSNGTWHKHCMDTMIARKIE